MLEIDTEIGLDLLSVDLLELLPNDVKLIYHLAATNGTHKFYDDPTGVLLNNTLATLCFSDFLAQNPDVRFIFASTCEIQNSTTDLGWGEVPTPEHVPVTFNDPTNPRWSYSIPKVLGENFVANLSSNYGILRYFNIFGPGQKAHFIPEFHERVLEGDYQIYGNDTRSFCYIDDAVQMTCLVGNSQVSGETFNIGNPEEQKIEDVARLILNFNGVSSGELLINEGLEGSANRRCPDMSKFEEFFGRFKYTSFEVALRETLAN